MSEAMIPTDPDSDCLMAYSGPGLEAVFALEVLSNMFLFGSYDGMIRGFFLEDPFTACELASHRRAVRALEAVDEEKVLYSCSADGTVKTWDLATKTEVTTRQVPGGDDVRCMAVLGRQLAAGSADGTVTLWDVDDHPTHTTSHLRVHAGAVTSISLHHNAASQLLSFTTSDDSLAKLFDVTTGQLIAIYEGQGPLSCSAFHPDSSLLYVGGSSPRVLMFDVRSAGCVGQLRGHTGAVGGMVLVPEEAEPTLGPRQSTTRRSVVSTGRRASKAPPRPPSGVLYTASDDLTVARWDLSTQRHEYTFRGHTAPISCVTLSKATKQLYTGAHDASVRVWDTEGARHNLALASLSATQQNPTAASRQDAKSPKKGSKRKPKQKGA